MTRIGKSVLAWALIAIAAAAASIAAPSEAPREAVQGFDIQVPFAPMPADSGGAPQLVHELHLTNFAARPIAIERIEIVEPVGGAVLGAVEGEALSAAIGHAGAAASGDRRIVPPGGRAIVYFNLPLPASARPDRIRHRVAFRFPNEDGAAVRETHGPAVEVARAPLPVLGPPLRGGPWVAVYDPAMERGHRRVHYATEGVARLPGRFAIDWFAVDEQGRQNRGDGVRAGQVQGYGAEVLAVADGVIAAVRDDMAEPRAGDAAARVPIGDASGNYVALDLGDGRYAFYEHLRPGVPVRPGQQVRRGDVVGFLGLTGQTTGPHLHFHLADAPSPLDAEGLPYLIEGFDLLGGYASIEAFVRGGPWDAAPERSAAQGARFPAANWVVHFPGRR